MLTMQRSQITTTEHNLTEGVRNGNYVKLTARGCKVPKKQYRDQQQQKRRKKEKKMNNRDCFTTLIDSYSTCLNWFCCGWFKQNNNKIWMRNKLCNYDILTNHVFEEIYEISFSAATKEKQRSCLSYWSQAFENTDLRYKRFRVILFAESRQ